MAPGCSAHDPSAPLTVDTTNAPSPSSVDQSPATYSVPTEAHLLEQVIVHTPGPEMELVSPENREELLFDDILFVGHARQEHLLMCSVFEKIVGRSDTVLQIEDLLLDTFEAEEAARHSFVEKLCQSLPEQNLGAVEEELKRFSPEDLQQFALTGQSELPIRAQPVPNLMFTRDLAAVVHDHIILSHAATVARTRESIIINVILHHHPRFAPHSDKVIELPPGVTFEGGDLLVSGLATSRSPPSKVTPGGSSMTLSLCCANRG